MKNLLYTVELPEDYEATSTTTFMSPIEDKGIIQVYIQKINSTKKEADIWWTSLSDEIRDYLHNKYYGNQLYCDVTYIHKMELKENT